MENNLTGSSRLPIGKFKFLLPKLTVVKKYCEEDDLPKLFENSRIY